MRVMAVLEVGEDGPKLANKRVGMTAERKDYVGERIELARQN